MDLKENILQKQFIFNQVYPVSNLSGIWWSNWQNKSSHYKHTWKRGNRDGVPFLSCIFRTVCTSRRPSNLGRPHVPTKTPRSHPEFIIILSKPDPPGKKTRNLDEGYDVLRYGSPDENLWGPHNPDYPFDWVGSIWHGVKPNIEGTPFFPIKTFEK